MRRRVTCGACGWVGCVPIDVKLVFHKCRPTRRHQAVTLGDGWPATLEERSIELWSTWRK